MGRILALLECDMEEFVPRVKKTPGTSTRKQYYDKSWAPPMKECAPKANINCFMHVIDYDLVQQASS